MTKEILGIIFDMDGTLVSSSKVIFEGYQYALEPWSITLNKTQIESIRAKKPEVLFEDWGLNTEQSLHAVARMNEYCKQNASRSQVFPEIELMLNFLSQKNILLAIWTGRNTQAAKELLNTHHLAHFFSPIIGATCVTNNKPHPEGIHQIVKFWGLSPNKILMVGDHDHDIEAGKAAGCLTARASWREHNPTHIKEMKADWDFTAPLEITELFAS